MLKGKTILLGVTGGIAAYKIPNLASMLVKAGALVHVVMTKNATEFITPLTFESITKQRCIIDSFDRNFEFHISHISLAKKVDAILIAPATANTLAKLAQGLADDLLSTTVLASTAPKLLAPAMNSAMYKNVATQRNLSILSSDGFEIIPPESGWLACGEEGVGKMPEPKLLFQHLLKACSKKDLAGKNILISAGPTQEPLDPVRFLTNHSSGKMGYALAKAAMERGAEVILVSGVTSLTPPISIQTISVKTASDMFQAMQEQAPKADILIMAAAVADYRPVSPATEKIKKKGATSSLSLEKTQDILASLGTQKKKNQFFCGFAMETEHLISNATEKLHKKNLDMIVANHLKEEGAGFQVDTNVVTCIGTDFQEAFPLLSKEEVAHRILDLILQKSS